MRKLLYSLIVIIAVCSAVAGCRNSRSGGESRDRVAEVDSLVRGMCVEVYSMPDSIFERSMELMAASSDSLERNYLKVTAGFSGLLTGKRALYDSLSTEVRRYCAAHPADLSLSEFYHRNRAVAFNLMGNNDSAYFHMTNALGKALESRNFALAVEDEAALGDFAEALGELPLAVSHLRRAVTLADSIGYKGQRSFAVSLGSLYSSMGNYDEADRYFELHRLKKEQYPPYINFFYYSSKGNRYYYQKRFSEAADNFREALDIISTVGDPYLKAMTDVNLGECLLYLGQTDSAEYYIGKGTRSFDDMGIQDLTQKGYMASLLGALATAKGDYENARRLLITPGVDTLSLPPKYRMLHYNRIVDLLRKRGDYKGALEYMDKADFLEDELEDISVRNYAAELENRYMQDTILLNAKVMMAHKEEEVMLLHQWIYLAIAITVAVVLLSILVTGYNTHKRRKAVANMQMSLLNLRLESVRNRVSPHFIFNVLNSELDSQANSVVMPLVELIRKNLELANSPVISLSEELDFINNYIALKGPSIGEDFEYDLKVGEGVDTGMLIPSMLIELFVENAMKHGLAGFDGPKLLLVDISRRGDTTEVEIINNGHMASPANTRGTGTGLRIVNQTIHTLNSVNQRHIHLHQEIVERGDVAGGKCYRVLLSIPDGYDLSPLTIH